MNTIAKPKSSLMLQNCKEKACTFLHAFSNALLIQGEEYTVRIHSDWSMLCFSHIII